MSLETMGVGIGRADDTSQANGFALVFDEAIIACTIEHGTFTSDEVRDWLDAHGIAATAHELLGLGPAMLRAKRAGLIARTSESRYSKLPQHHRLLTVWAAAK